MSAMIFIHGSDYKSSNVTINNITKKGETINKYYNELN